MERYNSAMWVEQRDHAKVLPAPRMWWWAGIQIQQERLWEAWLRAPRFLLESHSDWEGQQILYQKWWKRHLQFRSDSILYDWKPNWIWIVSRFSWLVWYRIPSCGAYGGLRWLLTLIWTKVTVLRMSNLDVGEAKGKDSASFFQELLYSQLSRGKSWWSLWYLPWPKVVGRTPRHPKDSLLIAKI